MSTTARRNDKRNKWPRVRVVKGRKNPWMVDARINGTGERFFFATVVEADTKADALRIARKNGGTEATTIPARLREEALDAQRRLAAVGVTITQAVDYYLAHARPAGGERKLRDVVAEFIAAKRAAGRKESYLEVQGYVLGNVLAREFGDRMVNEITDAEIDAWMNRQKWSLRTRLNYFSDVRNLFGFAVRKGYRPTNPMERLEKPTVTEKSPGILTPDQASALLIAASAGEGEMLPAVALGLFAGLRTAELEVLEWQHVDLAERNIHIPPEVAKTREGRDVQILDNLAAWLQPYAKRSGQIAPPKSFRLAPCSTGRGCGH
jgi:integrase